MSNISPIAGQPVLIDDISLETSPSATTFRFTVDQEHYEDAVDFFNDAARWNRTHIKIISDEPVEIIDGNGHRAVRILTFEFLPDNADGTFSEKYSKYMESTKRMFQGRMDSAGITNYA